VNLSSSADVIVGVENLRLHFDDGKIKALNGIDLEIREHEFVAIVGPSGCGKSSLLNVIGTLDTQTSGEIYFRSRPYSTIRDASLFRRQHIGFIFQSFHLIPTLSALDNVIVPTIGCPGSANHHRERARGLLSKLGLRERLHQFPSRTSGGERQRIAIARALINEPDVILADEPTGSLDSTNAAQVLDVIAEVRKEKGLTLILVTHDTTVSSRADRVVHVRDGRIEHQVEPHR
jgi:putative ABC transport system ATP-binding protein